MTARQDVTDLAKFTLAHSDGVSPDSFPIDASAVDVDLSASPIRALRANGAGVVVCDTALATNRTLNFGAGETRYVCITKVYHTGTTATGLEGMP